MPRKNSLNRKNRAFLADSDATRVVLYVRASTPEQVNSLDAQQKRAAAFCEAKGLVIHETFVDAGVSAVHNGIRDRPQARRMFAHIRKHGIATVLVLRLDRAFRTSLDFSQTITWALSEGFSFRFIEPDVDYGSPIGRMFAQMEAARAEMECALRSSRVDDALDTMRDGRLSRNGNQAGYGWRAVPDESGKRTRKGGPQYHHLPVPAEQAVLRHMKALWQERAGEHGALTAIAATLNALGIPTKIPAGTVIRRKYRLPGGSTEIRVIITDGIWKPATVKSVLEHAVLATDSEMPDGLPSLDHAVSMLTATRLNVQPA